MILELKEMLRAMLPLSNGTEGGHGAPGRETRLARTIPPMTAPAGHAGIARHAARPRIVLVEGTARSPSHAGFDLNVFAICHHVAQPPLWRRSMGRLAELGE